MPELKNGLLIDNLITQKIIANIEHQVLDSKDINAIVLHQTDTADAKSTMENVWSTRIFGAHFLIDRGGDDIHKGEDGKIYQTAHVNRRCWHVGHVKSKCMIENTCTIPAKKKTSLEAAAKTVAATDRIEFGKSYPNRYPINSDSIGIEMVTVFNIKQNVYPAPSHMQMLAVSYLIEQLVANIPSLSEAEDIYTHGDIGRKKPSEGTRAIKVYTDIKSNAALYLQQMMPKK